MLISRLGERASKLQNKIIARLRQILFYTIGTFYY